MAPRWGSRARGWSLSVADLVAQLAEEGPQFCEPLGAELALPIRLDLSDDLAHRLDDGVAASGQADSPRAPVVGILRAGQVAGLLHVAQQVVHRLLGHAGLGGEL